jgi:hypothetical protein
MDWIHPAKVGLRIRVEQSEASLPPRSSIVDPEPIVARERIAHPLGVRSVLDDDNDSTALLQVSDGDPMPLTRSAANRFNYQRVAPGIWRPRNPGAKGKNSHRVCEAHQCPWETHSD